MCLERKLVRAVLSRENEEVLDLLKAGANPKYIDQKERLYVAYIALLEENWQAVVHLIDFGATLGSTPQATANMRRVACEKAGLEP